MNGKMRHLFGLSLCLIIAAWANLSWAGASGEWLSLGIGRGNTTAKVTNEKLDDPAILLAGSVLRDSHIWSLRYSRVGLELSRGDVALLYERVLSRRRALVSVGAGFGILYRDSAGTISDPGCCALESVHESEFFNEAGVAWAAQVTTGSRSDVGLGLQGFGSFSGDGSFWGVALVVQFGERGAGG